MLWAAAALLSAAVWVYLLVAHDGYWRMRDRAHDFPTPSLTPRIAVIVPARDEAPAIHRAVQSLMGQDYPGELFVFVVDDHSSDGTADVARRTGDERVAVLPARSLPPGWSGKVWAMAEGVRRASIFSPAYYLFTDADVVHAEDNVSQLVARAESQSYDLVSLMVRLRCVSLAERALIPAFVYFFFQLYPPQSMCGAAGGCMLIRREVLDRIGGLECIRGELIDDCALASQVKRAGGRVWLGLTTATKSIREYGSFDDVEKMIARTAYTQLRNSPWVLLATLVGLALVYIAPLAVLFSRQKLATMAGLLAWIMMSITFVPALRFYRRSWFWAPSLPLIAMFYMGATCHSAWQHWRGRGGAWKGRTA